MRVLGRMREQPMHATPGTHYDDAMLTVVLAGRGHYLRRGRQVAVAGGMIGMVTPDGDAGLLMADIDDPYDHLYCRFAGREAMAAARRIAKSLGPDRFAPSDRWRDVANVLFRAMALGPVQAVREHDEATRHDAALLDALAILEAPQREPQRTLLTAARLRLYMEEHLSSPADLDAVAEHFAVSKPHLCRTAKRLLGQPLHEAWTQLKIEWARVLLAEPTLSVKQVARRVGYADPLYFSKVFRKLTGRPPSQARR